jgi:hypothetical protein
MHQIVPTSLHPTGALRFAAFPSLTTPEEIGCEKSQGKFDLQWTWRKQPYLRTLSGETPA